MKRVVINALAYKQNSSGIGVMLRELFGAFTFLTKRSCQVVVPGDAPDFPCADSTEVVRIPYAHGQTLRRLWFQTVRLGRDHGKQAVLLVTDSKMPFFLPKSCVAVPLITDLAVFRMPEVYQTSRVFWWRLQYRYVTRRADFFLAISEFTKGEMVRFLHLPPERIHIVPCACGAQMKRVEEKKTLQALREKYSLPEQFLLFVGNTNPRKNLQRLIRAFDKAKECGLAHQLIIAGEQGWKFDKTAVLEGVVHKQDIRFIGFVPEEQMPALYSAAAVFAFPTLYEGFGIPVLEAQACGTPVLTSDRSSLPEVGGVGAVYVDPYSEQAICDGLLKLVNNTRLRERLIEKGYENVKRFSWTVSAQKLNDWIEENVTG